MKFTWVQWFIPTIPANWEVEIGESQFEARLGKKVTKTLSQITSWVSIIPARRRRWR
jgi:hypothetical protein